MARAGGRPSREARDRARLYQARKDFQEGLGRRRRRDDLVAGIGGGLLVAGLIAVQTLYFVSGPGATPEPGPSPIATVAPTDLTPSPGATVSPAPGPSPSATD